MINNLTFFEDAEDLEKLTGLTHEGLWDAGFDLDDFDWGFCSDTNYCSVSVDEYGYKVDDPSFDAPWYAYQILQWMNDCCVGFKHTEYGGKHFYMQYHS